MQTFANRRRTPFLAVLAVLFMGTVSSAAAAVPEISSVLQATAPVNSVFTYTITATDSPTSFSASNFPTGAGWGVNTSTGVISGTPDTVGTYNINIGAANGSGNATATLVLMVYDPNSGGAPVITSDTAFTLVVNTAAANVYQIAATNTPTSFGATNLPAGLSVNTATGVISAAATTAPVGQYTITVSASNAAGTGTFPVIVIVNSSAGAPVISNPSPTTASGGDNPPLPPITVSSGSPTLFNAVNLPAGLSVNTSNGTFTGSNPGTVWALATYYAIDGLGRTGVKTVVIQIFPPQPPPSFTSGPPPDGMVGQPYSYQMTVNASGTTFNAVGLLNGLTMNTSTGLISGIPTAPGQFTVTLSSTLAFGRSGQTGAAPVTIRINPAPPTITSTTSVSGMVGTPLTYQILATGSPSSFDATNLPPGLSVNASGLITGTPTTAGTFMTSVSASKAGLTGTALVAFTIAAPASPIIASALTANASKGMPFNYQLAATGAGPIVFSAANLPPGLTFAVDTISGTPSVAGQTFITLTATNSIGTTTALLKLTIAGSTGNNPPAFDSPPTATPNPAQTGAIVAFTASATDPDADLVALSWDFGDGLFGSGSSVTHSYSAPGLYLVQVTASDGTNNTTQALGVGINDPAAPAESATASKASIHFDFKHQNRDSLMLSGTLTLPASLSLASKKVSISIGGLEKDFVLSGRGRSGDNASSFVINASKQTARYTLNLRRQTLFTALQSLGFANATVSRPGKKIALPVTLSIDGVSSVATMTVTYTSTENKSGSAR